jgi:nicotinate phosphoribosyltransferase
MARAVVVADMIRGFMEPGYALYCGDKARHIIPNMQKLFEQELARGSKIFYVCDNHDKDDPEFAMFAPHAIEGSIESEVIPEFKKYPGKYIPKKSYSLFHNTTLDDELNKLKPETVVVCGVLTHICVLIGAMESRVRHYPVEVPVDCVADIDEKEHVWALDYIEKVLGCKLTRANPIELPKPRFEIPKRILSGDTTDIYFARTVEILKKENINPVATMEVFPSRAGTLCGIEEVKALLEKVLPEDNREVWAVPEGESVQRKEVVLRITAPYQSYGVFETVYLGMLSHCTGWATAAKECVEAAEGIPVISFGARHVHPLVAGVMDYSAIVGGCAGCSSVSGAKLAGQTAAGTMPHALIIIMGDTATAMKAFNKHMPPEVPRVALVDTFRDEPEESIIVAQALKGKLEGVRLDTPGERGRVTADLVKETRARLDLAGFKEVKIFVSGGLDPERIRYFLDEGAPVDFFGVGSYISGARPIDFTADLHDIAGKPIAKRGRIPGITPNSRLKRIL